MAPTAHLLTGLTVLIVVLPAPAAPPRLEYNRDVRPILANNCFKCHGPDAKERKADLRLDLREEAVNPNESGRQPIAPGKPAGSSLIASIFSTKSNRLMPPPESNKSLTESEKIALRRWI